MAINFYLNLAYHSFLPCRELYYLTIVMPVRLEFSYFILQISHMKYRISRKLTYSLYFFFHRILEIHSRGLGSNLYPTTLWWEQKEMLLTVEDVNKGAKPSSSIKPRKYWLLLWSHLNLDCILHFWALGTGCADLTLAQVWRGNHQNLGLLVHATAPRPHTHSGDTPSLQEQPQRVPVGWLQDQAPRLPPYRATSRKGEGGRFLTQQTDGGSKITA